jgi:hypothetical protein
MTSSSGTGLSTARFGARQRRGVLLGFSGLRLAAIGTALLLAVLGLFTGGPVGALLVSPLIAALFASAFVRVGGRAVIEWAPVAGHWTLRRANGQTIYSVRPSRPRAAGTLALPADAAALRVHIDPVTGAAMVHDPHRQTLTATCLLTHPAFVLLGADDQQRRVSGWGRALAMLARSGHTAAVQVLETTIPDSGTAVLDWWSAHGVHDQSWPARTYAEFVGNAAPSSARHRTTISLSLDMRRASRAISQAGRGLTGAAAVLRQDMSVLDAALRNAELQPERWLTHEQLAGVIRTAYDPRAATTLDANPIGRRLATAGPVGIREHWGWFEHDQAATAVLWISEWPRSGAYPNFLHPLLLNPGVRKSFTLVAHPVPVDEARRDIRRAKVEYITDSEQKARIGQVADVSDAQEYADILRREQEIAVGHADMRFAGLLAVTAEDKPALDAAVAQVEQAALTSECETRTLVGQQCQAFVAAALPLGRGL